MPGTIQKGRCYKNPAGLGGLWIPQNGCQATQTTLPRRGRAKTTRKIAAKTTDASSKVLVVDLFIRR